MYINNDPTEKNIAFYDPNMAGLGTDLKKLVKNVTSAPIKLVKATVEGAGDALKALGKGDIKGVVKGVAKPLEKSLKPLAPVVENKHVNKLLAQAAPIVSLLPGIGTAVGAGMAAAAAVGKVRNQKKEAAKTEAEIRQMQKDINDYNAYYNQPAASQLAAQTSAQQAELILAQQASTQQKTDNQKLLVYGALGLGAVAVLLIATRRK